MSIIEVNGITKDYGGGKGVFDVSFAVEQGEIMGFLGPNGAGKTTTIRHLMGFIRPDNGSVRVAGMDCFAMAHEIQKRLGYLPGEIAFIDDMTGIAFIRFVARMKGLVSMKRAEELMDFLNLDPKGKIKKMSKGMKQKIAIVCAFMQEPEILILDEPSSGLDPLMQGKFVELTLAEKKKGATILMSSHVFEEVEKTCDRTAIIKDGRIVAIENMEHLRKNRKKTYVIRFATPAEAVRYAEGCRGLQPVVRRDSVMADVAGDVSGFLATLAGYQVADLDVRGQTLEELFMHFYGGEEE